MNGGEPRLFFKYILILFENSTMTKLPGDLPCDYDCGRRRQEVHVDVAENSLTINAWIRLIVLGVPRVHMRMKGS